MPRKLLPPEPLPAPEPPSDLSESSQALWRVLVPGRARSPERLELLAVALRARDRLTEIRAILQTEGLTTKTAATGAVHVHPLAKLELETRRQLAVIWGQLNLQWNTMIDGRILSSEVGL